MIAKGLSGQEKNKNKIQILCGTSRQQLPDSSWKSHFRQSRASDDVSGVRGEPGV